MTKFSPEQVRGMLADAAETEQAREEQAAIEEIAGLRGRGRPKLAPGENTTHVIVRVPTSIRDKIAARAAAEHKTVAAWTRDAIDQHLADAA